MKPRLRKFTLTTHVTASVGWLGAVAAYLTPAVAGVASEDAQMLRAARPELVKGFAPFKPF
jgi:hypothetical protein